MEKKGAKAIVRQRADEGNEAGNVGERERNDCQQMATIVVIKQRLERQGANI